MKYRFSILPILMLSFCLSFAQNNCRSIDSIVVELKQANYLKNSKKITGLATTKFSERIDSQYVRYEELSNCASIDKLIKLMNNENNVIVAYSWKAFLNTNSKEALHFLLTNSDSLSKRKISVFLNYCQGTVTNSLEFFMVHELYNKLLSRQIELTSSCLLYTSPSPRDRG